MQKFSLFHQFILELQSILESCYQTDHTQTVFDQLFIYVNLYQHVKNQAILLICSGDIVKEGNSYAGQYRGKFLCTYFYP